MGKNRHGGANSLIKQNLLGGVADVIFAANDMTNSHINIVNHHRQIIEGLAIGTGNHHITAQIARAPGDFTAHSILPAHRTRFFNAKPNHRLMAFGLKSSPLFSGQVTVAVVVTGGFTGGLLSRAQLFQFGFTAIAIVGLASTKKLLHNLAVAIQAVSLKNRPLLKIEP